MFLGMLIFGVGGFAVGYFLHDQIKVKLDALKAKL